MKTKGLYHDHELESRRTGTRPTPPRTVDLGRVDPRKIARARELLGSVSATEAVEVALDLLVLDDAHRTGQP